MTDRVYTCRECDRPFSGPARGWTRDGGALCGDCAEAETLDRCSDSHYAAPLRWIDPDGKRARRGRERRDEKP